MQVNLWDVLQGLLAPFALTVEVLAVSQSEWWRKTEETIQDVQDYVYEALTLSRRRTGRLTVVSIHADRLRALRELPMKRCLAEALARSSNVGKGLNALYHDLHMVFGLIIAGATFITLYLAVSFYLGISTDLQATGEYYWLFALSVCSAVILLLLVRYQSSWARVSNWIVAFLFLVGIATCVGNVYQATGGCRLLPLGFSLLPLGAVFLWMLVSGQSRWVRMLLWIVGLLLAAGAVAWVGYVYFKFRLSLGGFVFYWFWLNQFYIGAIVWRLSHLKRDSDRIRDEVALRLQAVPGTFC